MNDIKYVEPKKKKGGGLFGGINSFFKNPADAISQKVLSGGAKTAAHTVLEPVHSVLDKYQDKAPKDKGVAGPSKLESASKYLLIDPSEDLTAVLKKQMEDRKNGR